MIKIKLSSLTLVWALANILRAGKWGLLVLFFLIFVQGLLPSATLYVLKSLTESIGQVDTLSQASIILAFWVGLIVLENIVMPLAQMVRIKVNERIHSYFSLLLMNKANSLSGLEAFESKSFQDEIAVLREETKNKPINLMYILTDSLKGLIAIVSIFAILGSISGWLPIIIACSILPQVIFAFLSEKKIWDYSLFRSEEARKMGRICSLCLDQSTIKEIRIFGCGNHLVEKFRLLSEFFRKKMASLRSKQYASSIPYSLCAVAGQVIVIGWIAGHLTNNTLALASIIVMVQSLHFLQREVLAFTQDVTMLSSVVSYFQTFKKFMSQQDTLPDQKGELSLPLRTIEFREITFGYETDRPILNNLSLSIRAGEKIAIVGANGSGKSTLIKLLCRFYDPSKGSIIVNGTNLKEITLAEWRKQISVIFQDFGKYPLSVAENIAISNLSKLQDTGIIAEAIEKGGLSDLIDKFPEGIHTLLGKEFSGKEMSFGEWQKLAICRLFFRDASIIVMDEPTASLDPNAEHEMFLQLTQAFEGKTVLLISHRLNSVKMCDRILMLKNGCIVEDGSHDELMLCKGEYYDLFSLQAQGYQQSEESELALHV